MSFGINLMLAALWAALIGPFTPTNLLVGFVAGFLVLTLAASTGFNTGYPRRVVAIIVLAVFTIYELILANFRVAWYTISTLRSLRPAILDVPLEPGMSDAEITLLSSLITLTPGTLTLDVSNDRSILRVHFMHVEDPQAAIEDIKDGFERRVREATR
ncbi:MAG: Na+/H+ antiporter subunit E [Planctomycetota bacterium]